MAANPGGLNGAFCGTRGMHVDLVVVVVHIQQRNIEMLAPTGIVPVA